MYVIMEVAVLLYLLTSLALKFTTGHENVTLMYITPNSLKVPCPDESHPCHTLSEFAADISSRTWNHSKSVELVLLPGEHYLDISIILKNISEFVMRSTSTDIVSQITCEINKTRFHFQQTRKVWIDGLKFVGCGNNTAEFVESMTIKYTIFLGQNGSGTALILVETNADIVDTTFDSNVVGTILFMHNEHGILPFYFGGAILATHSNMEVRDSKFLRNHARNFGGAIFTRMDSNITLINTTFTENSVCVDPNMLCYGGAICHEFPVQPLHRSRLIIITSTFHHNTALSGAVFTTQNSDVEVNFTNFYRNYSPLNQLPRSKLGQIIDLAGNTHLITNGSNFYNNTGGTVIYGGEFVIISYSHFLNNKGRLGGVLHNTVIGASVIIRRSHFSNNSAYQGGVLLVERCSVTIQECEFDDNHVIADSTLQSYDTSSDGGVLISQNSYVTIDKTVFTNNRAEGNGGIGGALRLISNVTLFIVTCTFWNNYAQKDGGAIASTKSTIVLRGRNYVMENHAHKSGGGYAIDSSVLNVNGELVISNNTASDSGGGMILTQSELKCEHYCIIRYVQNIAMYGGGIYAESSTISLLVDRTSIANPSISVTENNAYQGGGMFFAYSAKLQIEKVGNYFTPLQHNLLFTANTADYGGALFVDDATYFDICLLNAECFLQVVSIDSTLNHINATDTLKFARNSARNAGSVLYGGLLDRCEVSPLTEVIVANGGVPVDGITFFKNVSMMSENKGIVISSKPARVCLCSNGQPDCTGNSSTIEVRKGEIFTLPLVAVDQVNRSNCYLPIDNMTVVMYAQLTYTKSGLGVGQMAQITIPGNCSNLNYSIYSPYPSEELTLYASGPCGNTANSIIKLRIDFQECACPVGFHPRQLQIDNDCVCDCDPKLQLYITSCDPQTNTLTRHGNSWMTFLNITNDTNQYNYLTYLYCPLDYCLPPDTIVEINLNVHDGSDVLCRNNRSGLLCGICRPGFSVSLGTSRCISCNGSHDLWWLILIFITAGVALVVVLLVLNMTVAIGTLNGLIFYAHIVGATNSIYFPTASTRPAYVIVSWLNLDLGFDACFIDGLDTYMKTWIQMAFPTYIIFLLVVMIVWSERSLKFARIIGRKNPVALLATLTFLSYAKFLSTIISALLFITLEYPDGSHKAVWLPDASVDYLSAKHLVLVTVAIIVLLIGSVYTILLLLWQWIRKWAVGKVSHKVCHFFDLYQAPYNLKHRYWPGLLLLARVILYLLFAFNQSGDPGVNLIGIIIVICSILLLKGACGYVYKNKVIDFLEFTSYINIAVFSAVQLYSLQSGKSQTISAFLSVSITATLLIIVVSYHVFTTIVIKGWQKYKSKIKHTRCDPVTQNRPQVNEMRPYYFHDSIEHDFVSTSVVEFPRIENCNDENNCEDDNVEEDQNFDSEGDSCDNVDSSIPLLS